MIKDVLANVNINRSNSYDINDLDSIINICENVIEQSGLKIIERDIDHGRLIISSPMSWYSWGEIISIELSRLDSSVEMEIRSRCKLITQIIDWGKNRRNVNKILIALRSRLGK